MAAEVSSTTSCHRPVREGRKLWCHSSRLATKAVPSRAIDGPPKSPFGLPGAGRVSRQARNSRMLSKAVAEDMAGLAQQEVPGFKAGVIDTKQEVQQRIENLAGVVRREIRARFDGDDDQPQDSGDPRFQNMVSSDRSSEWQTAEIPCPAAEAQSGAEMPRPARFLCDAVYSIA